MNRVMMVPWQPWQPCSGACGSSWPAERNIYWHSLELSLSGIHPEIFAKCTNDALHDAYLVEPSLHIVLPVLVEVLVRHDIVPLCRHLLCNVNSFEILGLGLGHK